MVLGRLIGNASVRASEELGVPRVLVQSRPDELLRRRKARIMAFQATQILSHGDTAGMGMVNGLAKAVAEAGTCFSRSSWCNTKPTNNPTTVPKWNGDAKHFDDYEFYVIMYKRKGSKPGDHCFLVPRLILGLIGRTREHLRVVGDSCR